MAKGQFNPSMVNAIFKRDGGRCIYCGALAQEIDHVIPFEWGGKQIRSNGVCACIKCNRQKRDSPNDITFFTRAIFWLLQQEEDVTWMDDFVPK